MPTSPKPFTTATLPAIITSVPRRMPSTSDSRQPYRLSNFDFVTLSFTLIAGTSRVPSRAMSRSRCTPVVVSSDTPRTSASISGYFWCISWVTSPPSSRIMFGVQPSGPRTVCSMHHQNSSSVSPFQANTGTPAAAIAAAAWSWVEKMLHDDHRTVAPSACRVSISTAVCTVMCRQPTMRAPASGFAAPYSARTAIRPGISSSAMAISLRPHSAWEMSFTL